jgi:hypothetical protein
MPGRRSRRSGSKVSTVGRPQAVAAGAAVPREAMTWRYCSAVRSAATRQVKRSSTRRRPRRRCGAQLRVVEEPLDRRGQRARLPGGDQQRGVPVGAGHLGQRPAGGRHQRRAARHRLDGREREALVQGGHHGDLRAGEQAGELLVVDAVDEAHRLVGQGQLLHRPVGEPALLAAPDDDQVHVLAVRADLRQGLQQRHQALQRRVGAGGGHQAAGDAGDVLAGTEALLVHPVVHHLELLTWHVERRDDVVPPTAPRPSRGGAAAAPPAPACG